MPKPYETEISRKPLKRDSVYEEVIYSKTFTAWKRAHVCVGDIVKVLDIYSGSVVPYRKRIGRVVGIVRPEFYGDEPMFCRISPLVRVIGLVPGKPRIIVDVPWYVLGKVSLERYQAQREQDMGGRGHGHQYRAKSI